MGDDLVAYLAIAAGAVLGANARYLVSSGMAERFGPYFPYGTLLINVTGSIAIGLFLTLAAGRLPIGPQWRLFFVTGFLGAYTTFSAYTYEAAQLLRNGEWGPALAYILGSVVLGMLGVFGGILLGEAL